MRRLKDTPGQRAPFDEPPAGITGAGGANGQAAGEDLPATAKPDGRKRAMLVRHNKIHKLFEDGLGDLTVTYLAKKCGVNRKTIQRDLKALGLEIPRTDDLPPENVP